MDEDGVVASATGTVAFAAASVILAVYREELAAQGNGWWLLVAVAGDPVCGDHLVEQRDVDANGVPDRLRQAGRRLSRDVGVGPATMLDGDDPSIGG